MALFEFSADASNAGSFEGLSLHHKTLAQDVGNALTSSDVGASFVGSAASPNASSRSATATPLSASRDMSQDGNQEAKTTLWMGDLDPWMDENFIKHVWSHFGEQVEVKMIRDKFSGMNAGYCFVDFASHASAVKALLGLNGTMVPGTNKIFKLNWATGGGLSDKKEYHGPEFSIFVGDLGPEVDDDLLFQTFSQHYPSCRTAKVVTDAVTGLSRGYGFVRFTDELEQQRAMVEMQGQYCGSRLMRISVATPKNRFGNLAHWNTTQSWAHAASHDPSNTTVFVGGLTNGYVSEEDLVGAFAPFGPITYVKIPPGKGCGFVSYVHRQSAEQAIAQLNGSLIGNNRIRLSWGRNSASTTPYLNSIGAAPSQPNPVATSVGGAVWKQPVPVSSAGYHALSAASSPRSPDRLFFASQQSTATTPSPFSTPSSNSSLMEMIGYTELDSINWRAPESNLNNSIVPSTMATSSNSGILDPITRPSTSFANPLPSTLGSRVHPIFGAMSAPASPEHRKMSATPVPDLSKLSDIWS